ncbi:MAG: response regulator [Myxococcales bacterium]
MDPTTRARLLGIFVAEAEQVLNFLDEEVKRLEPTESGDRLIALGRSAHGLKGAASSVGLVDLAQALHDLERFALALPSVELGAWSGERARLLRAIELLREGVATMAAAGNGSFPSVLLEQVALMLGRAAPAPAAGSAPAPEIRTSGAGATPRAQSVVRGSSSATAGAAEALSERISIPAEEIDATLRMASVLARGLSHAQEQLRDTPAGRSLDALSVDAAHLEAAIANLRLVPARSVLPGFDEEVAQLALTLGKQVDLQVEGTEVRADRRTLATARRLIGHLVRNALDHGLEGASARFAADKPVVGRLTVRFEIINSALCVVVEDDGAGFDVPAIRKKLAQRGEDPNEIETLADGEVLQRFALAGGSTRAEATLVSGRGLGLSAVASLARAAGGDIALSSKAGQGSTVQFTLPPEVYALEVLAVCARGLWAGVPSGAVERVVYLHEPLAPSVRTLPVDESIVPFMPLSPILGGAPSASRFAVVVKAAEGSLALGADDLGRLHWLVPHAVTGVVGKDSLVLGLSRLPEGGILPILNPALLRPGLLQPRPAARAQPDRPEAGGPLELVLAEDSLATREVLRVLLQERGYTVRLAADGEEALRRVEEHLPDVVVTDINMPRCDGFALTRALRSRPETAHLPIILLTSQDDEASRVAGAAAGADAHLLKSNFNASVLEQTLSELGLRGPS